MCQIFAMEEKIKHSIATNFWSCFSLQISMYMLNEKTFFLLISQTVNEGVVYFVLASVQSSPVLAHFCRIGNHALTSTIEHGFGNSIDQSERA